LRRRRARQVLVLSLLFLLPLLPAALSTRAYRLALVLAMMSHMLQVR
jgi:hypothetical protein